MRGAAATAVGEVGAGSAALAGTDAAISRRAASMTRAIPVSYSMSAPLARRPVGKFARPERARASAAEPAPEADGTRVRDT